MLLPLRRRGECCYPCCMARRVPNGSMGCFVDPTRRIQSCSFMSSYPKSSTYVFCNHLLVIIAELCWAYTSRLLQIEDCGCRVPLDTAELMAMEYGHIPVVDKTSRGEHDAGCVSFGSWCNGAVMRLLLLATSIILPACRGFFLLRAAIIKRKCNLSNPA